MSSFFVFVLFSIECIVFYDPFRLRDLTDLWPRRQPRRRGAQKDSGSHRPDRPGGLSQRALPILWPSGPKVRLSAPSGIKITTVYE